jgi:hypothetical protein
LIILRYVAAVWLFLAAQAAFAGPPAPLACVEKYYGARAVEKDGAWFADLGGGRLQPYDDRRDKSFDAQLDAPDVQDMFAQPYHAGAIRPVTTENDDPGRIRIDALFQLAYPTASLRKMTFLGQPVRVHEKAAAALARVEQRLLAALAADPSLRKFLARLGGTFNPRKIAGTSRASAHSYGVALDIDPSASDYWRWQKKGPLRWVNRVPQTIVDAFEAEGFIWGGRWYHFDTMHFEYRPELLDPACRPPG